MAQKRVGRDLKANSGFCLEPPRRLHGARKRLVLGLRRREGPKVVLANNRCGQRVEYRAVQLTWLVQLAATLQRVPQLTEPHVVRIGAATCRETGAEVGWHLISRSHHDVGWQDVVERTRQRSRWWTTLPHHANDLTRRMHTSVGAPGHDNVTTRIVQTVDRTRQLTFDGACPRLLRPTVKPRAVVGDLQARIDHRTGSMRSRS